MWLAFQQGRLVPEQCSSTAAALHSHQYQITSMLAWKQVTLRASLNSLVSVAYEAARQQICTCHMLRYIAPTPEHQAENTSLSTGRGRQVIAVCKSADLLLMVLDASKPHAHRKILTAELEAVGIRLNRRPPSIYFKKKKTGGISFNATVPLTRMDEKLCQRILQVSK